MDPRTPHRRRVRALRRRVRPDPADGRPRPLRTAPVRPGREPGRRTARRTGLRPPDRRPGPLAPHARGPRALAGTRHRAARRPRHSRGDGRRLLEVRADLPPDRGVGRGAGALDPRRVPLRRARVGRAAGTRRRRDLRRRDAHGRQRHAAPPSEPRRRDSYAAHARRPAALGPRAPDVRRGVAGVRRAGARGRRPCAAVGTRRRRGGAPAVVARSGRHAAGAGPHRTGVRARVARPSRIAGGRRLECRAWGGFVGTRLEALTPARAPRRPCARPGRAGGRGA